MIAGVWHRDTVGWVIAAACLPAAAVAVADQGAEALWRMGLCLVVIFGWQTVFLLVRAQPLSPVAFATAVAVAVLAPGELAAWQLVLAVSFGTVIGEQIFGGWGRNVVSAAVASLAFLYFAFPEVAHAGAGPLLGLAALPAALLLIVTGIAAWQVLAAAFAGLCATTLALGGDPALIPLQGSLVFGLVFLVCDPVASTATRPGRWAYGLLAGGLIALFGWGDSGIGAPQAVVLAALLSSLFAPLVDAASIAATAYKRNRSDG